MKKYIVTGFYKGLQYVSRYNHYEYDNSNILELTDDKARAEKMELANAAAAAKLLKEKGFFEINIKECK